MDKDQSWQYLPEEEVISALSSDAARGLEASAVSHRQVMFGKNCLWNAGTPRHRSGAVKYILDGAVIFLLADLLCAAFAGFDFQFVLILLLTLLFVSFRLVCEAILERLARRGAVGRIPETLVLRGGKARTVPADELVPGDVVILSEGDLIGADMRVISADSLVVSEKGVTGNDIPVEKTSGALPRRPSSSVNEDMSDMLFAFSYVLGGSARAVCVATGDHTLAAGKGLVQSFPVQAESAAMKRAERISAISSSVLLAAALVYVLVGLFAFRGKFTVTGMFLGALSFAVAGCGTAWYSIVLLARTRKMIRLARAGVSVRSPDLPENAARCAVFVCRDVSELTAGRGEICRVVTCGRSFEDGALTVDNGDLREFFRMLLLGTWSVAGIASPGRSAPPPRALHPAVADYLHRTKQRPAELIRDAVPVGFAPKGPENALDTVMYFEKGTFHAVCAGDAETVLSVCRTVILDGYEELLTDTKRRKYLEMASELEKSGYRVTAISYRQPPTANFSMLPVIQNSMGFAGFVAVRSLPDPMTAGLIRGFSSPEHSVLCFASCGSDAVLASSEGMVAGAEICRVNNADEANAVRFEKGKNYIVCISSDRITPDERIRLCLILMRRIKKSVGDIVCAGDSLSDAVFVREAGVKICLVADRRLRPAPYSLTASADALCRSPHGSAACPGMSALLSVSDESGRFSVIRKYLLLSQLLRAVLLAVTLFIPPVIPPVVYLLWGLLLDTAVGVTVLLSKGAGAHAGRPKDKKKARRWRKK